MWRKCHGQASPALAVLLPGLDLSYLEAGPAQAEWDGQIGPYRIAGEIELIQIVPGSFPSIAGERCARICTLRNNCTLGRLDREMVRREYAALIGTAERSEFGTLPAQINGDLYAGPRRSPFHRP